MKAERLHRLLDDLMHEYSDMSIDQEMSNIEASLSAVVSSPTAESAAAFRAALSSLETRLLEAPSNSIPPTYKRLQAQVGLEANYGTGLRDRIRTVIASSNLVPAEALSAIQNIRGSLRESHKVVTSAVKAFERFEVDMEGLSPGEFEFGFLLPEEVADARLAAFAKEIDELNLLVRTFQELAGEDVDGAKLRGVSASDWGIFLGLAPVAAGGLATAIERIVALYKTNLEIKLLRRQFADKVPEATPAIDAAIEQRVSDGIEGVVKTVLEAFPVQGDAERRNELEVQLKMRLRWLARRMESGALVEVRAEPFELVEEPDDEDSADIAQLPQEANNATMLLVEKVNASTGLVLQMDAADGIQIFNEIAQHPVHRPPGG